ncbi:hypothetical protein [Senegalia massiliensis]|uniref:hypothetical protein n=1 Tax=Senegalia massiliensis TaxID=1720316 RepID=UPI001362CD29|nr:hypothetical protein [Senegalia massiliensis]
MRKSENSQKASSLIWSLLILCTGCIGYVIWKEWLFLIGGLIGFTSIFLLKK